MKPIAQLTGDDINRMPYYELLAYESEVQTKIQQLHYQRMSHLTTYHEMTRMLKQKTAGYVEFQTRAYGMYKEYLQWGREIGKLETDFVSLKRAWERQHGTNQVRIWMKTSEGTPVAVAGT